MAIFAFHFGHFGKTGIAAEFVWLRLVAFRLA